MSLNLDKYNFTEYKEFDINLLKFDPEVRELCRMNTCGQFGRNHMCPPAVKRIEEWEKEIKRFGKALIATKAFPLTSKMDFKGMMKALKRFQKLLLECKEELEKEYPGKKLFLLGAGFCTYCEKCSILKDEPCRFPDKSFPSIEACGIDVITLSKNLGVKYNNGQNTVTYFGIILDQG